MLVHFNVRDVASVNCEVTSEEALKVYDLIKNQLCGIVYDDCPPSIDLLRLEIVVMPNLKYTIQTLNWIFYKKAARLLSGFLWP